MRRDSLLNSYSIPLSGGLLATCINAQKSGFRQRDAKFYIELIMNWLSYGLTEPAPILANMQISRLLVECTDNGLLKLKKTKSVPNYYFTRAGIIEFISRLRLAANSYKPEYFSFLIYFIDTYAERVKEVILNNGAKMPPALLIEVESLLEKKEIIKDRLRWIDTEILKLEERIKSSVESSLYAKQILQKGSSIRDVANQIEERWPYSLNSMKSFSSVIMDLDPKYQEWELKEGGVLRSKLIWKEQVSILAEHRRSVAAIKI